MSYGDRAGRTIADVLAEQQVTGCVVVADDRLSQEKLENEVDFLGALERALRSLIEDPGTDRYTMCVFALRFHEPPGHPFSHLIDH